MRPYLQTGALGFLAVASPALLAASFLPGRAAAWIFALFAGAFPVALMALGAERRGRGPDRPRRRRVGPGWALLGLLVVLEATAASILILAGAPAGSVRSAASLGVAGLPLATVIQVAGLWLLPLPLAALGYALTFERAGITEGDLEGLRERAGSSRG